MKVSRLLKVLFFFVIFLYPDARARAQTANQSLEKVMPSVVLVLTGKGDGLLEKLGSGVVIQNNGVILTAYHLVKDASQVQVRLKNGEIFDRVDLLGFDERRDVAALKIPVSNLTAIAATVGESKIGEKIYVISNPQGLNWSVADGVVSAYRPADEIPNAGRGFRVVQFSAPVSAGSSGGLVINESGEAVGLIVGTLAAGQNLNFAVPLAGVRGLAENTQKIMSFGSGSSLDLPQAVRPPSSAEIVNAEPDEILRAARIFYIYSSSTLISDKMMEGALMKMPEFEKWKLRIISEQKNADLLINVEHQLYTFDYRFTMSDRRTGLVLASGKVTVWDGNMASSRFAKMIVAKLKDIKEPKTETKNEKSGKN